MSALSDQTRWLDMTDQASLVSSGQVTPQELLEAAVDRIEEENPHLGAVTSSYVEQARATAAAGPTGPLAGVPFLVKDLFTDVAGQVCSNGNAALRALSRPAAEDGPTVARWRAAGLVFVGRTATSEFGSLPTAESTAWGATRNPWDATRTTGGSSGGSAAAVASGMVPAAHGTDAAGSIRIPASCCGLVGLKSSRPAARGAAASAQDLITELAVTRSVRDTAALLDLADGLSSPEGGYRAQLGADPGRLRIGLLDARVDGSPVHPACARAATRAGEQLESSGHVLEPGFPAALGSPTLDRLFTAFFATGIDDIFSDVAGQLGREVTPADVEPLNWALAALARELTTAERQAALDAAPDFVASVTSWWEDFDLLLTPTLAEPPLPLGVLAPDPADPLRPLARARQWALHTPFVNMTGQPAISLPVGVDDDGLPTGVQLVAAPGREDQLLQVAAQLEEALPWRDRHPTP